MSTKTETEILECGHPESPHEPFTRGYGKDENGNRYCYECCAEQDRRHMIEAGVITLYLTTTTAPAEAINWPGSLRFLVRHVRHGCHNIARTRYDVWFDGPDGHLWHGVQYGDYTQILHCKRTKERTR